MVAAAPQVGSGGQEPPQSLEGDSSLGEGDRKYDSFWGEGGAALQAAGVRIVNNNGIDDRNTVFDQMLRKENLIVRKENLIVQNLQSSILNFQLFDLIVKFVISFLDYIFAYIIEIKYPALRYLSVCVCAFV